MSEQRLIDANALTVRFVQMARDHRPVISLAEIDAAPTVEPKRGEWKINSNGYYPYCFACGQTPKGGDMTDFCPSCGADMRKE